MRRLSINAKGHGPEAIDSAPIGDTIEVAESGEVIFYSNWYGADGDEHGVSFELIRRESSLVDIPGTIGFNGIMMNLPASDYQISQAGPPDGAYTAFNYQSGQSDKWQWRVYLGGEGSAELEPISPELQTLANNEGLGILAGGSEANAYGSASEAYYKAPQDQRFRVTQGGSVEFFLGDSFAQDNLGGVSIRVVSLGQGTPAITHVVTASSGTGGGIAPSGSISVSEGGSVGFEVTPDSDNRLSGITGTCLASSIGRCHTTGAITQDCDVIANFEAIPASSYIVIASAGVGGGISPTGSQTVDEGGTLSFTITASAGYQLDNVGGTRQ